MKKIIIFCWAWLTWLSPILILAQLSNVWQVTDGAGTIKDIDFDNENNVLINAVRVDTISIENVIILKYANTGEFLWQTAYTYGPYSIEDAYDMSIAPDNSVIVAGKAETEFADDYLVLKYDAQGALQWLDLYNVSYQDEARYSAIDSEGYIYVVGDTYTLPSYITRYSPDGAILWRDTLPDTNGTLYSLLLDEEENIYTGGTALQPSTGEYVAALYKVGTDGETIWENLFTLPDTDVASVLKVMGVLENNIPITLVGFGEAALIAHNPEDGSHLWETILPMDITYYPEISLNAARDHFAISGRPGHDLCYYNSSGNMLWHVQKDPFPQPFNVDVEIAPNGVIYWLTHDTLYVYGSDGTELYVHAFGEDMKPKFIRFDSEGYLYVVGSKIVDGFYRIALEKYQTDIADNLPAPVGAGVGLSASYISGSGAGAMVHFYTLSDKAVSGSVLRVYDICGREVHSGVVSDTREGYNWYIEERKPARGIYVAVWEHWGQVLGRCRVVLGQ